MLLHMLNVAIILSDHCGQVWWHTPLFPQAQEAEAEDSQV